MRSAHYYGSRIYEQAVTDPEVNPLDEEELEEFARMWANKLCLKEEPIVEEVLKIQPNTTGFQKAADLDVLNQPLHF